MNPYHLIVEQYARLASEGKKSPLGAFQNCVRPVLLPDAPNVVIFAPHPDDEVIIGALPLRLLREAKWNIVNVAVTLGSKQERRSQRLIELQNCCRCIGFELVQTNPGGLENVNTRFRTNDPVAWADSVTVIADIIRQYKPLVILFPHEEDWNSTHIGTHFLVLDALRTLPKTHTCYAVETEYWSAMASPNLMVELSNEDLGDLVTALTFHIGEVRRNPYHLSMIAWMMDNVRRGTELVGGQGSIAPDFVFSTLYRLRQWKDGSLREIFKGGKCLPKDGNPASLFDAS
jgi:LmbE family N-acetylglucosaminyl deacetylase